MERLRDTNENWGMSPVEYAQRDKMRLRERMKKRMQRARIKITPPPMICEHPVDNYRLKALKGQDIQELGIMSYRKYVPNRTALGIPMTDKANGDWVSLPYVSILYGAVE